LNRSKREKWLQSLFLYLFFFLLAWITAFTNLSIKLLARPNDFDWLKLVLNFKIAKIWCLNQFLHETWLMALILYTNLLLKFFCLLLFSQINFINWKVALQIIFSSIAGLRLNFQSPRSSCSSKRVLAKVSKLNLPLISASAFYNNSINGIK
jgi:hypothetical protein